jgi:hypothetical protein
MIEPISNNDIKTRHSNILGLLQPELFQCHVEDYKTTHSILHISIYKAIPGDAIRLTFTGVCLFDGPMQWLGANFSRGTKDELLAVVQTLGWADGAPQEALPYLANELMIFQNICLKPNYNLRIIASDVLSSR